MQKHKTQSEKIKYIKIDNRNNSAPRARIKMKYSGNCSYKPPGPPYAAQGPQKQPENINTILLMRSTTYNILDFLTWISVSRPLEPALGRKFHVESEIEVYLSYFNVQREATVCVLRHISMGNQNAFMAILVYCSLPSVLRLA